MASPLMEKPSSREECRVQKYAERLDVLKINSNAEQQKKQQQQQQQLQIQQQQTATLDFLDRLFSPPTPTVSTVTTVSSASSAPTPRTPELRSMATGGYPCRPQGIITGGGDIPVNGVYGYASMGNVYNGVAIAGSSEGGRQGLQHLPQQFTVWTPDEHRIFMEGLQKYCTDPIVDKYAKIAAALPRKTIRDVALRLKWLMARKERRKRIRDGCHNSIINNNKKERIIYPSNSHALQMPHMPGDDNGDIRRTLFDLNKDIFKKVSENSQASENIELLYHALNNLFEILRINVIPDKENKMPPLPVNLNAQLVQFILQCLNKPHGEKLHK
ncbi:uncharacterized protein LOC120270088 isoform X2 [Dioscorea cayenensis subsp. rotundata]|uniref:Uncharacterized protein LOC120270088 isoform X2 n=1 Tax=Dioscorea cayennensis subsp. rotundata TaxID=55577 RepID=A0AB40C348_DIOCR|nr:uncharacterized protein LOC120270088 isoform X2 [Dioscorea cayenensis subsp. rotundata]